MNEPITIDPEFQSLIPPLSDEEYLQLEENCRRDGIMDSLKVWHGILVDGHNRYRISEEWDLNYQVEEIDFPDRDDVIQWIILNQFGRRNLSAYDRSILALKLKPMIAEKAKEKQSEAGGAVRQKSDKAEVNTKKELAKVAGVSHDTIHKVEVIEHNASEPVKNAVRSGEISINNAYQQVMREKTPMTAKSKTEAFEAKQRHKEFEQKKSENIVNIQDAQRDKQDQQIIAQSLYKDILSLTAKSYWIGALNTAEDFERVVSIIPDKNRTAEKIRAMVNVLEKLLEML